jgi:DNA-binding transcriptional MerR regulator
MSTQSAVQDSPRPVPAGRYSLAELAALSGMSPRNIRAHQTRRILHPPVRSGRASCYDDSHLRRLTEIRRLQDQGFNLVAIEAVLGDGGAAGDGMGALLRRVGTHHPRLVDGLHRHGVIRRTPDGTLRPAHPQVLRSVLDLHRAGVPAPLSLQVLVEALDRMRPAGGDGARATVVSPEPADLPGPADLLTEVFRLTLQHRRPPA